MVADNLPVLSSQLRALGAFRENNLGQVSDDILALSQNVGAVNEQIDQLVVAVGALEGVSSQLRGLAPYADADFALVAEDISALSQNVAAINQQVDQYETLLTNNLTNLSVQLRGLEAYGDTNLDTISQDVLALSGNVGQIKTQVGEFSNLIDEYIAVIDNVSATITNVDTNLDSQLGSAKTLIIVVMIWILLAQLTPLYLGWELVAGRRSS